ncbi:MAG: primase-helicase zinc-binding domain-containing protein [Nanoarchaeota archaeon]
MIKEIIKSKWPKIRYILEADECKIEEICPNCGSCNTYRFSSSVGSYPHLFCKVCGFDDCLKWNVS